MRNAAVAVPGRPRGHAEAGDPAGARRPGAAGARTGAAVLAAVVALTGAVVPVPGAAARAAAAAVPHRPDPPAAEEARTEAGADSDKDSKKDSEKDARRDSEKDARTGSTTTPRPESAATGDTKRATAKRAAAKRTAAKRTKALRMGFAIPTRIRIPSIGVNAPLVKITTDRRGRLQVPPLSRPGVAGWYVGGASPGQIGPAVIVGHMDTRTGPAVFYRLRKIKRGARVYVDRRDGSTAVFQVRKRIRVPKTAFPTDKVYGDIRNSGLRLITCGGAFDNRTRHYRDNVIVFARLARAITPRAA